MVVLTSPRFLTLYYSRNLKKLGGTVLITSCNTTGFNFLAPCHTAQLARFMPSEAFETLLLKVGSCRWLNSGQSIRQAPSTFLAVSFLRFLGQRSMTKAPADAGSGSQPQVSDRASPAQTPVLPVTSSCADWEQVTIPRQRKSKPQNERSLSDVCWLR